MAEDEYNDLGFRLDHRILARTNKNVINTEFVLYLQSINRLVNEVPDNLRNMCDIYNRIRVSYKFRKIVEQLSRNKSGMLFNQDKGRSVAVIDRKKHP